MIQEIRIKNFLSFRDEVVLNFEATKDKTFEDCQVVSVTPKVRLLRFALIYGPNASGKSNLLSAFDFLHDFGLTLKQILMKKRALFHSCWIQILLMSHLSSILFFT